MKSSKTFWGLLLIAALLIPLITACSGGPRDPQVKSLGDETYLVPTGHSIEFFEVSSKQNLLVKVIDAKTVKTINVIIEKDLTIDKKTDVYYGVLGHVTIEPVTGGMKIQSHSKASLTFN